ncbi:MAG TPA: DNA polymerase III subunit gamma/tau [Sphingobacteriaceae bacterium]|nr:DNA polymerase III subunit gamma/tau [Sphingobacteriaceae bacterium]
MDNFIVSARKYRPATFDTVVGQQHITGTLKNAIKNKQLAQAFLFCGPRGVGKTTCARILAKTINCQNISENAEACGTCESCQSFQNGNSFSIHELDAASNNSVDDIRALTEQVRIPPQSGKYKIYIIDEVHMLSQQAFNAFLKTLEEPPSYAIFILATTEKHKILPTILSRCQIFDFNRIKVEDMALHLEQIAGKESIGFDRDGLHLIAQKADGGLRDALSMFDQIVSFSNKNISYQAVIDNLNILDYDYYFRIAQPILEEDAAQGLLIFDHVLSNGFDGSHFISGLSDHFRNLLVAKDAETVKLLEVSQNIKERYLAQSKSMDTGLLLSALNIANQCEINFKNSRNQRLQVELALLKMCHVSSAILMNQEIPSDLIQNTEGKKKTTDRNVETSDKNVEKPAKPYLKESKPKLANESNSDAVNDNKPDVENKQQEHKVIPQSPIENKAEEKPKLFIPRLKDVSISSSIPSLNSVFNEKESEENNEPTYIKGTEKNEFTESEFLSQWNAFAEISKAENKISLYTLMIANPPKLKDNFKVDVIVENGVQSHLLLNAKVDILNFLRQNLENYYIDLSPIIQTNTIIRKPITDVEKYQAMLIKNPLLDKLRQEFNLGFE